jgi:hypothetical protein
MPYDAITRRYIPDVQAPQVQMPGWVPMDDQNDQNMDENIATIGGAFKDRLSRAGTARKGDQALDKIGDAAGASKAGGGGKSLG